MSDSTAALPVAPAAEDRMLPAVVYGLYLIGLANGLLVPSSGIGFVREGSPVLLRYEAFP